jgi:hypothetical protein
MSAILEKKPHTAAGSKLSSPLALFLPAMATSSEYKNKTHHPRSWSV